MKEKFLPPHSVACQVLDALPVVSTERFRRNAVLSLEWIGRICAATNFGEHTAAVAARFGEVAAKLDARRDDALLPHINKLQEQANGRTSQQCERRAPMPMAITTVLDNPETCPTKAQVSIAAAMASMVRAHPHEAEKMAHAIKAAYAPMLARDPRFVDEMAEIAAKLLVRATTTEPETHRDGSLMRITPTVMQTY